MKIAVSINEAVAISGIGRTSLYHLIKCNSISTRKFGRKTLVLVEELETFVKTLPRSNEGDH